MKFDDYVCNVDSFTEPQSYREAIESPLKEKWAEAMKTELESLKKNETWTLQTLPKGRSAIPCKFVLKVKRQPDATIERFKTRLVAKGFMQRKGLITKRPIALLQDSPQYGHDDNQHQSKISCKWKDGSNAIRCNHSIPLRKTKCWNIHAAVWRL